MIQRCSCPGQLILFVGARTFVDGPEQPVAVEQEIRNPCIMARRGAANGRLGLATMSSTRLTTALDGMVSLRLHSFSQCGSRLRSSSRATLGVWSHTCARRVTAWSAVLSKLNTLRVALHSKAVPLLTVRRASSKRAHICDSDPSPTCAVSRLTLCRPYRTIIRIRGLAFFRVHYP